MSKTVGHKVAVIYAAINTKSIVSFIDVQLKWICGLFMWLEHSIWCHSWGNPLLPKTNLFLELPLFLFIEELFWLLLRNAQYCMTPVKLRLNDLFVVCSLHLNRFDAPRSWFVSLLIFIGSMHIAQIVSSFCVSCENNIQSNIYSVLTDFSRYNDYSLFSWQEWFLLMAM